MNFTEYARVLAIEWKQATPTLPEGARKPGPYRGGGPYDFCLPTEFAVYNLLPDARAEGLSRFMAAGIPWHQGRAGIPSTHLLSSQVQCVNALAPMIRDGESLKQFFGGVLDIATVLPFGDLAFDPEDLMVFEWVGLDNYLGEWSGKLPTRGANVTSTDAAIRYETSDGSVEVALVEWKYTEEYHGKRLNKERTTKVRMPRYRERFLSGPYRTDRIQYEDLFVEPLYQMMRQQLLAHAMEEAHELGAERVRVVYAAPSRNSELRTSLLDVHKAATASDDLIDVWQGMLRDDFADRFHYLDTAALVAPAAPTSEEFRTRYGHIGLTP
jgi:hypothetical protein